MKDYPAKKLIARRVPEPVEMVEVVDFAPNEVEFTKEGKEPEVAHYPAQNELGKKLQHLRESQGLTFEQVASRLDGEVWRVNVMEHAPDPSISVLSQYAAALDAEVVLDVRQTQASLRAERDKILDRLAVVESQIEGLEYGGK